MMIYRPFSWQLLALVALLINLILQAYSSDNEKSSRSRPDMLPSVAREVDFMNTLQPIHLNQSAIMFWRPQKVGSSTILSLLVSYGYRYNALPRRKSSYVNSLCSKMALCSLRIMNDTETSSGMISNVTTQYEGRTRPERIKYLFEYIKRRSYSPGSFMPELRRGALLTEKTAESQVYKISSSHQVCNLDSDVIKESINCVFSNSNNSDKADRKPYVDVKELFIVRDPLSRAISVYYFWGELFKMHKLIKRKQGKSRPRRVLAEVEPDKNKIQLGGLGNGDSLDAVKGTLFTYHGDETTVPSEEYALAFARKLPYTAGMPGPSFTWSAFATSADSAIEEITSDRIMTIVTERLDESLVVASHYLGWSLADVVVTVARKALSHHPKHPDWPQSAVDTIKQYLTDTREYDVYNTAESKLNSRIEVLTLQGVNVTAEVETLQQLRHRVTKLCMSEEYLVSYRRDLRAQGYTQHLSNNKLRDTEDKYTHEGHCFSFNSDIMYTFDVCGNCEAHAILLAVEVGLSSNIEDAPTLAMLDKKHTLNNPNFAKCPK